MSALWGSLIGVIGAALSAAFFYFVVMPREAKKAVVADQAVDVLKEKVAAAQAQAAAVVTHEATDEKVVAIKVEADKEKNDDPVSVANALLRDATGRKPH